jgi:class 3 adenylate cyclase
MVVGGVPVPQNNNAERVAKAALEMCANPRQGWHSLDLPLSVPIGMATGEVVAGVIGRKNFIYDLWGDTVNVASRVEIPRSWGPDSVHGGSPVASRERF